MTNPITAIMNQLETVFVEMDAKVLADAQLWAKAKVAAIKEVKNRYNALPFNDRRVESHNYYTELFAVAGGKTWYNIFNGRNAAMIEEFMIKNCKATADARNASIAKKLLKLEATEVTESTMNRTSDGFHGFFQVMTNTGIKSINIDTIYAGGYNIQCFHVRTLVKVR